MPKAIWIVMCVLLLATSSGLYWLVTVQETAIALYEEVHKKQQLQIKGMERIANQHAVVAANSKIRIGLCKGDAEATESEMRTGLEACVEYLEQYRHLAEKCVGGLESIIYWDDIVNKKG